MTYEGVQLRGLSVWLTQLLCKRIRPDVTSRYSKSENSPDFLRLARVDVFQLGQEDAEDVEQEEEIDLQEERNETPSQKLAEV